MRELFRKTTLISSKNQYIHFPKNYIICEQHIVQNFLKLVLYLIENSE